MNTHCMENDGALRSGPIRWLAVGHRGCSAERQFGFIGTEYLYAAVVGATQTGAFYPHMVLRLDAFPPTMADVEPMISAPPLGEMQPVSVYPGANYDAGFLNQISLLPDGTGGVV